MAMQQFVRLSVLVPVLILGLLAPKFSALASYLNPNIMTVVICAGSELITIQIGPDGSPIEVTETDQGDCILTDPDALPDLTFAQWTKAPRSYRASFVEIARSARTEAEVGLLPDLRGPPFLI